MMSFLHRHLSLFLYAFKRSVFLYPDSVMLYMFSIFNCISVVSLPWYLVLFVVMTTLLFFIQRESVLLGNIVALTTYYVLYTHYTMPIVFVVMFACFIAAFRFTMRHSASNDTGAFIRTLLQQEHNRY